MTSHTGRRLWLVVPAIGVIAALLLSPATRWLVRQQLVADGLTLTSTAAQTRHGEDARRGYITAHPHDFQIQLAAADEANDPVVALRALLRPFRGNPAVYAALLRAEIRDDPESKTGVYVDRPDQDYYLSGEAPPRGDKAMPPSTALLAAFDADAAAGEHLDPDNAFFPLMHAAGLFAGHQDAQAQGAVLRAGRATAWREYLSDDIMGRIRLASTAEGGHATALSRLAIAESISLPQYVPVRAVARIATSEAAQSEEATGRPEQDMAIRHALLRCGGLMRADCNNYVGSRVGIAIAAIATERPDGTILPGAHVAGEEREALRIQTFVAYADHVGDHEDARRAQFEDRAEKTVRGIYRKAEDKEAPSTQQLTHLAAWWASDFVVLTDAAWLVLLAAIAACLGRLSSIRERRPLSEPAVAGLWAATILSDVHHVLDTFSLPTRLAAVFILLGSAAVVGIRLSMHTDQEGRHRLQQNAMKFACGFAGAVLIWLPLGSFAGHQISGIIHFFNTLWQTTDPPGAISSVPPLEDWGILFPAEIFSNTLPAVLPLLILIISIIAGRIRRLPVSVSIVDGFRLVGIPIACALLILYGGLVLGTLRQERIVDATVQQIVLHEGPYYASLAGALWPGPPKP